MQTPIYPELLRFLSEREQEFDQISPARKKQLQKLSSYLEKKYTEGKTPRLIVVCTHNSRRSHMGQVWLSVGAEYLGLPTLEAFSGGTEATAFNPRSVAALKKTGVQIVPKESTLGTTNPVYQVSWMGDMEPYEAFSKKLEHPKNPQEAFGAIMVCTEADEACPFVAGADFRLSLPYDDPKAFDDTELETEKYAARSRQIARELLFMLKKVSL